MAHCLAATIKELAQKYGIERLGFFTLTFADHVLLPKEANRRWNSLNRRVIKARYERCVKVMERQFSRRLHFHCVVVLPGDIRTGFDFEAAQKKPYGDYRSAGALLRREWAFWRATAPLYGFGRCELLPVRSTAEGIARYVGSYIRKGLAQRDLRDKGARLVSYVGFPPGTRTWKTRFQWRTPNSQLWRRKVAAFARSVGAENVEELKAIYGTRWCHLLQDEIMATPFDEEADYRLLFPKELLTETRLAAIRQSSSHTVAKPPRRPLGVDGKPIDLGRPDARARIREAARAFGTRTFTPSPRPPPAPPDVDWPDW